MVAREMPPIRVLVLCETGGHHIAFSQRARFELDKLSPVYNLQFDYIHNTSTINQESLADYRLFLQLDYPPYGWGSEAEAAFETYIERGEGGWLGFHHASLLGEFDGHPLWNWFSNFLGGIVYRNYIPGFVSGDVLIEASDHPVMRDIASPFTIKGEEWYIYDRSPRANVQVLAHVDEATYIPESAIKMGDHPVVWTNPAFKARNLYIFMGHSPTLFDNPAYSTLFRNALLWTLGYF